ncbi:hypothetical protein C2G38_2075551 [Gigaspora rosea]|uniref:BACK domain-containing protein n=1 Tax=Gigaspora rosea TaxID=44941 RepID=A0A397VME5_9GLOM|nr:hypothetical protein C2G38_2075551 [Gigaspora rosea]
MCFAHEFFLNELSHWLRLHFADVYQKSFQNNQLHELQKWCNDIVVKYPNKVFDSEDFTSFQENALISLLKRDDLQMEEGKIWNYVIKWGIAQNQGLPSDPEDWTPENFKALKTTLQNCLPLIRYFQISGNDIVDNKENVILIIKVKDTDEILGGYNPIGWEKPEYFNSKSCDKCFIFH